MILSPETTIYVGPAQPCPCYLPEFSQSGQKQTVTTDGKELLINISAKELLIMICLLKIVNETGDTQKKKMSEWRPFECDPCDFRARLYGEHIRFQKNPINMIKHVRVDRA